MADVNANVLPNQYRCDCGCNLDFIGYNVGFDIYVKSNWIITANSMVDYSWQDYILIDRFKIWSEFREDIILHYNHALNNVPMKAQDAPWIHLYNKHVLYSEIPLNGQLYYEHIF